MTVNIREKLQTRPKVCNMGLISNAEKFSARCSLFNKGGLDVELKLKDSGGIDMGPIPSQFHPAIQQALVSHIKDFYMPTRGFVHINQGTLQPGENFRVVDIHFDAPVLMYPDNWYPNNDVFIVSDCLQTKFYLQTFNLPAAQPAPTADLNWALSNIFREQARQEEAYTPPPLHLIRTDSYAVHEAQLPAVPTDRTFLMARFF